MMTTTETTAAGTYQQVSLGAIVPSTTNPRKSFDEASMADLIASVRAAGVQQPVLLRPRGEGFEIVCGERRFRAAKAAGLETIPAILREMTDNEALEAQIVENLQRTDIHPMQEAEAYAQLVEHAAGWAKPGQPARVAHTLTAEDIAKAVGKAVPYVAQRMKLLQLILVARELFEQNYITLGHALLLARLTSDDQDKAVRALLNGSGDYAKMSTLDVFAARKKNIATNDHAKHSRLVEMTEGELKAWIADNVMLKLKTAPWDLEDAQLVPAAGPCTSCPKRSGSNAALFADMTPDQDVCLDAACFGVKHKAFIVLTTKRAAEAGEPLLKLTTKSGHKKLPEEVTDKLTFRNGQWLKAKKGSCAAVRSGILIDSSSQWSQEKYSAGDIASVCVDQRCKVHKHTVEAIVKGGGNGSKPVAESWEVRQAREKKEVAELRSKEEPILRAVYDAMLAKLTPASLYLQSLVLDSAESNAGEICAEMGVVIPKKTREASILALKEFLAKATMEQMHKVAFHAMLIEELYPSDWTLRDNPKRVRETLWGAAKLLGVDAAAIAKAATPKPVKVASEPKPAAKKAVVAKKGVKSKPVKLSAEGKKRIADAMKKRWATARKKKATG
jgi:ParB family transcriptional regulator, chromosome partitioning protein